MISGTSPFCLPSTVRCVTKQKPAAPLLERRAADPQPAAGLALLIRPRLRAISSRPKGRTMKLLPTITLLATLSLVGCETSGGAAGAGDKPPATGSGAAGVGDIPPAAVQACMRGADDFWSAKPGTSAVIGAH